MSWVGNRTRQMQRLIAIALVVCSGCRHWTAPFAPPFETISQQEALPNPLLVPIVDRELLWNQLVDEIDDYFRIDREQRVHEIGGVLMEGRIETFPMSGSTIFEPWRRDSTPGFEKLHSTFQTIRRQASLRVVPQQTGFLVEVIIRKELEDVDQPERSSVGTSTARYDGALIRSERGRDDRPVTLGWITIGRDTSLEQQILFELKGRLSNIGPGKKK